MRDGLSAIYRSQQNGIQKIPNAEISIGGRSDELERVLRAQYHRGDLWPLFIVFLCSGMNIESGNDAGGRNRVYFDRC